MREALLVVHELSKHYGGVAALTDVTFTLDHGEVLGLVGPNGAGKTTLIDLICGAQSADAGLLTLQGGALRGSAARRARAGVARTFQYPQLALDLRARDNILVGCVAKEFDSFFRMLRGMARGVISPRSETYTALVDRVANDVHLAEIDRLASDLTLGEQRLVEVARALGQDPLVLLLDEPFAGSDATGAAGITEAIRAVRQRGHGAILVDHNVDLVAAVADRIVLLDRGSVVFDGRPEECLASDEMRRVYFGGSANDAA
jgi:branched-chain amino acid transport system ATP-binding protein